MDRYTPWRNNPMNYPTKRSSLFFLMISVFCFLSPSMCAANNAEFITPPVPSDMESWHANGDYISTPADPEATQKTREVLAYLRSLPSRQDKKVLSGQFIGWRYSEDTEMFDRISRLSAGKYPAIMSGNYADWGEGWYDFSSTNALLIDQWDNGGLVEVAWHANNPVTGATSWENSPRVDLAEVVKSGTTLNSNWNSELDGVATGLGELQDDGIVVLFRPLLEMNGDAFWWASRDETQYKDLWIYTFDYLTKTKGLHNLLWVYAADASMTNAALYYPGGQYVDIAGADYYSPGGTFTNTTAYDGLKITGKPFALTEVGQCNSQAYNNPSTCRGRDTMQIIDSIRQYMPDTIYWSNWNDCFSLDIHINVDQLFGDDWVVSREELNLGLWTQTTTTSSTSSTTLHKAGDANGDGVIDYDDLLILAASYGKNSVDAGYDIRTDYNGDGEIDYSDLIILAANYGK
jgi:mannan endo-1,4-beta-mannosidase